MKNLRSEYKLVIGLGIIFLIILVIVLVKENYISDKLDEYKAKQLITCSETKRNRGINFTEYTCNIKDEANNSYNLSYIQIDSKDSSVKQLNSTLKANYNKAYNNIEYIKEDNTIKLETYDSIEYKIYYYNGITSLLVKQKSIANNVLYNVDQYNIYNIDISSGKLINNSDMKTKTGITRDISSKLRTVVIKMYATKFSYDYNNEYGVYRNQNIDEAIENVTYNSIQNIYIDDNGYTNFIIYLYNPNKGERVPYQFKIDSKDNITYTEPE